MTGVLPSRLIPIIGMLAGRLVRGLPVLVALLEVIDLGSGISYMLSRPLVSSRASALFTSSRWTCLAPPSVMLGAWLPWEKFLWALLGSLDLVVLLKVILHVVMLVPTILMSRLFKKCKCLLALITDGHTLNEHDLCYIEGRWWYSSRVVKG